MCVVWIVWDLQVVQNKMQLVNGKLMFVQNDLQHYQSSNITSERDS